MSLCTTVYPLHTRSTNMVGTSFSEAAMRPNPRRVALAVVVNIVPVTVRTAQGLLSALRVFRCKFVLYGVFVWAHRALKHQKRRFRARAVLLLLDDVRHPRLSEPPGGRAPGLGGGRGERAMRWGETRRDAVTRRDDEMRCDAVRCGAVRCGAVRCGNQMRRGPMMRCDAI